MRVSIIIPVYNVEDYIETCLNSILAQTYKNIEIICVDDGSKDTSLNIIKKIKDRRIKIFEQSNKGAYLARKKGFIESTGEYIVFIDADDWVENDYIEILVNKAMQTNADMVRMSFTKNFEDEKRIKKEISPYKEDILISRKEFQTNLYPILIDTYFYNSMCCQLINRKYIEFSSNSSNIVMGEDLLFNLKLLGKVKSLYIINQNKYHYRYNKSSVTTSIDKISIEKKSDDIIHVYNQLRSLGIKWNFSEIEIQKCDERIIKEYINQMSYLFLDKKIIRKYSDFKKIFYNKKVEKTINNLKNKNIIDKCVKQYLKNPRVYYIYQKYIVKLILKIKELIKKMWRVKK